MNGQAEVPTGYVVDVWRVTRLISHGAWGSVYAAAPAAGGGGERVALKFLPVARLSRGQSELMAETARREADFSTRSDHPYLIRTLAVHTLSDPGDPSLDGAVVLVMELAAGSLKQLLETAEPGLSAAGLEGLLTQACEALAHMHARGWVHGDLKPGNVLVMSDGSVRIADFGLTAQLDGTHAYVPQIGSPDYLPPEWWAERAGERGTAVRATADIWAFGVLAHQVLAGGLYPFPGASSQARALAAQAYAAGAAPLRLDERIPSSWRALIADCLAPDHERRAAHDAGTLLRRIRGLPDGKPRAASGGRGLLTVFSLTAVLAAAGTAAWLTMRTAAVLPGRTPSGHAAVAASARSFPEGANCTPQIRSVTSLTLEPDQHLVIKGTCLGTESPVPGSSRDFRITDLEGHWAVCPDQSEPVTCGIAKRTSTSIMLDGLAGAYSPDGQELKIGDRVEISVGNRQPSGNCVVIVGQPGVANCEPGCIPKIGSVSQFNAGQAPTVVIKGSCFGSYNGISARFTDYSPFFNITDDSGRPLWGACTFNGTDFRPFGVSCDVPQWTPTSITFKGFGGEYGKMDGECIREMTYSSEYLTSETASPAYAMSEPEPRG